MSLAETLKTRSGRVRSRAIASKAEVRQGVVLAVLHELGWPIFDTDVVRPSHSINGDTVDFGLVGNQGNLVAVIIVDAPLALDIDGLDASLYVTDSDEPLVIHTNGLTWRFMLSLPPKGISCDKALVVPTEGSLSAERFESFLRRENLDGGHARETLTTLLARKPADSAVLMATWLSLIGSENPDLLTLFADKAEERSGIRPSVEEVAEFFRAQDSPPTTFDVVDAPTVSYKPTPAILTLKAEPEQGLSDNSTGCWYRVGEARFTARSAKDVVLGMLRYLENQSPGLLERVTKYPGNFGNSRRYIAHSPAQLYPKRPDYAADDGKYALIIPGLYLMTNSSTKRKKSIITLVTTVAGLTQGRDFDYAIDR